MFWLRDKLLKNSTIKNHYKDVKAKLYMNNDLALEQILLHTIQTVPNYKHINYSSLESFPVISKMIYRDNLDDFISDKFSKKLLFKAVTSGSTGTPFTVYHDLNKKNRNTADALIFAEKAGYSLGEPLYYFKIWTKINKKSNFQAWKENVFAVDVTDLSEKAIQSLIHRIEITSEKRHFIGYSSAFEAMCAYLESKNQRHNRLKVSSAISMSEALSEVTKVKMQQYFGVEVLSRYSNVENGIIAQQTLGISAFEINQASYFVEILDVDNDIPVQNGNIGRIVITDLYNYGMPIIRYDTGDLGVKEKDGVFSRVEGRRMDMVYNTNGDLVSSFTITNQMWKYPEIRQYQFIQTGKNNYLFKLNIEKSFPREDELIAEFKDYFGKDAEFKINYVNEIPLLNSGKRKKVMNEYLKNDN